MTQPAGPLPRLTPESQFFWTAHDDGALWMLRNPRTGEWMHPPPPDDPATGEELTPAPLSGKGTVFTFTINHQAFLPAVPVPYVVAIVELAEQQGLQLTTRIVNCDPVDVRIGMPVSVVFEDHDGVRLPFFEPDESGE
ncbi:Zn-ribbon domain-containing OB-fold protein [Mycolicibacterium porcinum]|nr:OB-fold domain-containing protein [Mycolicibacterium porcinum]CDO31225.1 putative nucleic-acid-binding protein containing a Zn-ribbon [Mycolicibacterium vulneris]